MPSAGPDYLRRLAAPDAWDMELDWCLKRPAIPVTRGSRQYSESGDAGARACGWTGYLKPPAAPDAPGSWQYGCLTMPEARACARTGYLKPPAAPDTPGSWQYGCLAMPGARACGWTGYLKHLAVPDTRGSKRYRVSVGAGCLSMWLDRTTCDDCPHLMPGARDWPGCLMVTGSAGYLPCNWTGAWVLGWRRVPEPVAGPLPEVPGGAGWLDRCLGSLAMPRAWGCGWTGAWRCRVPGRVVNRVLGCGVLGGSGWDR